MRRVPLYFAVSIPLLLALLAVLIVVVVSLELGVVEYAYERIGVPPRHVLALLLLSLIGSHVNVPVARLPARRGADPAGIASGARERLPIADGNAGTILAVNLGGAIVPTLLSLYLLVRTGAWGWGLAGAAIVALIVHRTARAIPGRGIAVPIFVPPLAAAGIALLLAPERAPVVAYVAGSLGTLVGADLLNLEKIAELEAPVASIGGAGTFDGIFLTGILAVLLA